MKFGPQHSFVIDVESDEVKLAKLKAANKLLADLIKIDARYRRQTAWLAKQRRLAGA